MKVIVRAKAEDDIVNIFTWISEDNPTAATKMVVHIRERINRLKTDSLAHMGHHGLVDGTREIVEYPVYRCRC